MVEDEKEDSRKREGESQMYTLLSPSLRIYSFGSIDIWQLLEPTGSSPCVDSGGVMRM